MPFSGILEIPEHGLDDEEWEDDEEFGAGDEELDLDEYEEDLDEEDVTEEL